MSYATKAIIVLGILAVVGIMLWQALATSGNPDVMDKNLSPTALVLSTAVLVFREGLEAMLVLAAVTAGMTRRKQKNHLLAVPVGAIAAFLAPIATWCIHRSGRAL